MLSGTESSCRSLYNLQKDKHSPCKSLYSWNRGQNSFLNVACVSLDKWHNLLYVVPTCGTEKQHLRLHVSVNLSTVSSKACSCSTLIGPRHLSRTLLRTRYCTSKKGFNITSPLQLKQNWNTKNIGSIKLFLEHSGHPYEMRSYTVKPKAGWNRKSLHAVAVWKSLADPSWHSV